MKKLCSLLAVLLVLSTLAVTSFAAEREIENLKLGQEVIFEQKWNKQKYFKITMPADGTLTIDLEAEYMIFLNLSDTNNNKIEVSDLKVSLGTGSGSTNITININEVEKRSTSSVIYRSLKKGTYYLTITTWWDSGNVTLSASSDAKTTDDPKVSISIPLKKGGTTQLGTVLSNTGNEQPTWTSSDNSIATVSSKGLVTAIKKGTTTVSVTIAGKRHSIAVVVTD